MIQINYRDTRPFYQQIKDNVRHLVVSGALKKDDKLPSVRELAASLAINPNTIQRAYAELTGNWKMKVISIPCPERAPLRQKWTIPIRSASRNYYHNLTRSYLSFSTCPCRSMSSQIVFFPSQEGGFRHDTGRTYYKNIPWI